MTRNQAKPKGFRRMNPKDYKKRHDAENKMHKLIKDLIDFEDFKSKILPAIQADVKAGMSAPELRKKYAALVQARLITDALMTEDAGKAAAVGKDVLDRVEGRATEKKEVTHKFAELPEKELDAILESEIQELEEIQQKFEQ